MDEQSYFKIRMFSLARALLYLAFISITVMSARAFAQIEPAEDYLHTPAAQLPHYFEEHKNSDGSSKYMARERGYKLNLDDFGHTIELYSLEKNTLQSKVEMRLVGANPYKYQGKDSLSSQVNYLLGQDKTEWISKAKTYSEVFASSVYPGIDLRYYNRNHQLEYDFIVAPKVDPSLIRLDFAGVDNVSLNKKGDLVLSINDGELHHQKPIIYQEINGNKIKVEGRYALYESSEAEHKAVGFIIGSYDTHYPLIIDPILDYASYLGGSGPDQGADITIDASGNIYMVGTSFSPDLPTEMAYKNSLLGRSDIFLTKFNPSGDTLVFATYLGGQNYDKATGISIDSDGNIIITGTTESKDFPTENAFQPDYGGGSSDAFVVKLSPDGSQILFSSYIGGKLEDKGRAVILDSKNDIYLAGETSSIDFPTENAFQSQLAGGTDAYVLKLNSDGSELSYSTYLGGVDYDSAHSIAIDNRGYATVTGITYSKVGFPLSSSALQTQHGGKSDVFISQLTADGKSLYYSSYLGGTGEEQGNGIALDDQNNIVVVGSTSQGHPFSTATDDFPTANPFQATRGGLEDGFISKLSSGGDELLFSSYLGGAQNDTLNSVALDDSSNIYVIGTSQSTSGLPIVDAIQDTLNQTDGVNSDVYLAKLSSDGSTVYFGSYFGGSKNDQGLSIAVDSSQTLYMAGVTASDSDFPLKDAFQPLLGGGVDDMFIAKLGTYLNSSPSIASISPNYINQGSFKLFTVAGANLTDVSITTSVTGLTIFDVVTTDNSATFRISANSAAQLGEAQLLFSSTYGDATAIINVVTPIPTLSVSPKPITLLEGTEKTLDIRLSGKDFVDHVLTLSSSDSLKASISKRSVTIPAGQTRPAEPVKILAHKAGSASLDITSEIFDDIHTTIFVTKDTYIPDVGENTIQSHPLGIVVTPPPTIAKLIELGPFVSQVSILKETAAEPNLTNATLVSPSLGISRGSVVSSINPEAYIRGAETTDMLISGRGLNNVSSIEVIPSEGITLGDLSIAADGRSIMLPVSVSPSATRGYHRVIVSTAEGEIAPEAIDTDRIFIADGQPEIGSITPVVMAKGETKELIIRGRNFYGTEDITLIPANGITVSSSVYSNSDNTQLTAKIYVDESASIGPHTVVVTTRSGSSVDNAVPANTLLITEEVGEFFSGILSPQLGIVKGQATITPTISRELQSPVLGVNFGAVLTGINPAVETIGSNFTMTLTGSGLQNVDAVRVEPAEGITLSSPTVSADGSEVTVDVSIAAEAAQTQRKIIASVNDVDIVSSPLTASRFLVTALQPKIDYISPNHLLAGGPSANVTFYGQYLNNAQSVVIKPAAGGITTDTPSVSSDGTRLTVAVSADSTAIAGEYLLKVITPSGETSSEKVPTNTLVVVSDLTQITPVFTTQLGVMKESASVEPETITQMFYSPLLGVEKSQAITVDSFDVPVHAPALGVAVGTVVTNVSPTALPIDTATALTITGVGLDAVESISFTPEEGITQESPFTVSSGNIKISVPVQVSADATQQPRLITLHTATGTLPFITAKINRLNIVDNILPKINSVAPIQQVPGSVFTLTIQGEHLSSAQLVKVTPSEGIALSAPIISNGDITVQMSISASAELGDRVVTVHALSGDSTSEILTSNTFSVVNQ